MVLDMFYFFSISADLRMLIEFRSKHHDCFTSKILTSTMKLVVSSQKPRVNVSPLFALSSVVIPVDESKEPQCVKSQNDSNLCVHLNFTIMLMLRGYVIPKTLM